MRINSSLLYYNKKRPRAWEGLTTILIIKGMFYSYFFNLFLGMLLIMKKKFYLSNNDKSMLFKIAYMLEIIICNDN